MENIPPPWEDLPQDLLYHIASLLHSNPIDTLSFRSVCKSWCSSSSLSLPKLLHPGLPLTLTTSLPPFLVSTKQCGCLRSTLSVTVIYALFPPISEDWDSAWILFVDQTNITKELTLRQPFSSHVYSLPPNFPHHLNFLDFRAFELGRFFNITRSTPERVSDFSSTLHKLVLLSIPCGFFLVALSNDGKLGLLTLPSLDTNNNGDNDKDKSNMVWDMIHDGKGFHFDDIVEFKGRALAIDRRARVHHIHIIGDSSFQPQVNINVIVPSPTGGRGRRKRLVESLGRLYLVVRNKSQHGKYSAITTATAVFKVYVLDEGAKKWVVVTSLGDRTFFFGVEFSFSSSADYLHGSCGKNWVLFKEHSFLNYTGTSDDNYLFVDVKPIDHLRIGVWRFDDDGHLAVIESYPNYATLFWPPPCWIWPNDLFERIRSLLNALDCLQSKFPDYKSLKANPDGLSRKKKKRAQIIKNLGTKLEDIRKEVREMSIHIGLVVFLWQDHYKSANLHNQGGTTSSENEESVSNVSFKIIRSAFKQRNKDLSSMEMRLHAAVFCLEESTSELEDQIHEFI